MSHQITALHSAREDASRYYRARAIQEQVAAQKATSQAARKRHEELATIYRFRAAMLPDEPSGAFA